MKRTIENLAQERKKKEDEFINKLQVISKKCVEFKESNQPVRFQHLLGRMEELLTTKETIPQKTKKRFFPFLSKKQGQDASQENINQQILFTLKEFQKSLEQNYNQTTDVFSSITDILRINAELIDAKDREWDALSSNHVGMIFKSMEWRIDKLTAEYKDANILMKKFLLLKEKLNALLSVLEKGRMPSSAQVKEILRPLEDWPYAAFENRFRGTEEQVKKQLLKYIPYFKKEGKVLDLGCGRGEFIEILTDSGIDAEGVDINEQMVDTCLEKGLSCQKGDLLERLNACEDGTLAGIFSSQVIEHLPPSYLKRMIELAYFKLSPSSYLVLETINPASVFSLVQIYYLDLSHEKPILPETLKFLLENSGFDDVEIQYSAPLEQEMLQNLPEADKISSLFNQNVDKLNNFLFAPANYAAIAQKNLKNC